MINCCLFPYSYFKLKQVENVFNVILENMIFPNAEDSCSQKFTSVKIGKLLNDVFCIFQTYNLTNTKYNHL